MTSTFGPRSIPVSSVSRSDLTQTQEAFGVAHGVPAMDDAPRRRVLACFHGKWSCGAPTLSSTSTGAIFNQSAFYCENDGTHGDGGTCELYVPIGAPTGSDSNDNFAAATDPDITQSDWWDYPTVLLPAHGLTGGARLDFEIPLRIKMTNLAARGATTLWLTIDPRSNVLLRDERDHSSQVDLLKPVRIGWVPGDTQSGGQRFEPGTLSSVGASPHVLVSLTAHGLLEGAKVHVCSARLGTGGGIDNAGNLVNVEDGQLYYVVTDSDPDVVDSDNTFTLSTTDPASSVTLVAFSADPTEDTSVIVSQPGRGSINRITIGFRYEVADDTGDWVPALLRGKVFADGRGTQTTEGLMVFAWLEQFDYAEAEYQDATVPDRLQPVGFSSGKVMRGFVSRTTPGTTMNAGQSGTPIALDGAPLVLVDQNYYADSTTFSATGATGSSDVLTHANFSNLTVGRSITVSASSDVGQLPNSGGGVSYRVLAKPADNQIQIATAASGVAEAFVGPLTCNVTTGAQTHRAYLTTMVDYGGEYDYVYLDAQPVDEPIPPTGSGSAHLALVSYLGPITKGQEYQRATITLVKRGTTVIGEVVQYWDIERKIAVRCYADGEHLAAGDAITLEVYRRERVSGTGTWKFGANSSTPTETYSANVDRVHLGPQGIPLCFRIAMSGPQDGDCQAHARGFVAELTNYGGV